MMILQKKYESMASKYRSACSNELKKKSWIVLVSDVNKSKTENYSMLYISYKNVMVHVEEMT